MAYTAISNVIVPEKYAKYLRQQTTYKSALFRSGAVTERPDFDAQLSSGGATFHFPSWKSIVGTVSQNYNSGTTITTNALSTSNMVAIRINRADGFASEDLAAQYAGDDPLGMFTGDVAEYWAVNQQSAMLSIMAGIFADNVANDSGDLVKAIAGEDASAYTTANYISADTVIDAKSLLGDNASKLKIMFVHSKVYADMLKQNLIDFEPTNTQNIGWGVYLGFTVVVDDTCTKTAGSKSGYKYSTYLLEPGTIAYGEDMSPKASENAVEFYRASATSQDEYFIRKSFSFLPYGFAWTGSSLALNSPTNAELATAANWNRVVDSAKDCGMVEIITNVSSEYTGS